MKKIIIILVAINICNCQKIKEEESGKKILTSGQFEITQTWSQEPSGYKREIFTRVPQDKTIKHPVVIVLHGNGGSADRFINQFNYLENRIIVAPQGYLRSWNIRKEKSKAPDIALIEQIFSYLEQFDNVDANDISIIGSSNGSALVNQLLIEFDDDAFKKAVCKVSQLNTFQYRNNSFWAQSVNNLFNIPVVPKPGRAILCLAGSDDNVANYYGGEGVLGYVFLNAQKSAFIFAKAMGYKGEEKTDEMAVEDPKNFFKYSYLDDNVIHYRLQGAGHGFGTMSADANQIIKNFIERK